MIYWILRFWAKVGLQWYVTDLRTENIKDQSSDLPSIIVGNHPNSFFDAVLLAVFHPKELYFLTRGDIFKKPFYNFLLRSINLLPIYKRNDADDTFTRNAFTYDECAIYLKNGKDILIFPEGRSHNQFNLQHFMTEGLDQLLQICYKKEVAVVVKPYCLDYSSFSYVPKSVRIKALSIIDSTDYIEEHTIQSSPIVSKIQSELTKSMESKALDPKVISDDLNRFLIIPAKIGFYTQYWFYKLWRDYIRKKTDGTIFYDSILFGCLLFSYPLFVLLTSIVLGWIFGIGIFVVVFILLPFTSYCMAKHKNIKVESNVTATKINFFPK